MTSNNDKNTVKINFEISENDYKRLKRYHPQYRLRHEIARISLLEYINRKEGRDKKLQHEKLIRDSAYIQEMIDNKLIRIQPDNGHIPTANNFRR